MCGITTNSPRENSMINVTAHFVGGEQLDLQLDDNSSIGELKAVVATHPNSPVLGVDPGNLTAYAGDIPQDNDTVMNDGDEYFILVAAAPIDIPAPHGWQHEGGDDDGHGGGDGGHGGGHDGGGYVPEGGVFVMDDV
jgi:hypothetical protein